MTDVDDRVRPGSQARPLGTWRSEDIQRWLRVYPVLRDRAPDVFSFQEAYDAWAVWGDMPTTAAGFGHIMRRMVEAGLVRKLKFRLYYVRTAAEIERDAGTGKPPHL